MFTSDAVTKCLRKTYDSKDDGHTIASILFDSSKSLNYIDHSKLIRKCTHMECAVMH